jgi:hypothetical protein
MDGCAKLTKVLILPEPRGQGEFAAHQSLPQIVEGLPVRLTTVALTGERPRRGVQPEETLRKRRGIHHVRALKMGHDQA